MQSSSFCSANSYGVGVVYEYPKKALSWLTFHFAVALFTTPSRAEWLIILWYMVVAFDHVS